MSTPLKLAIFDVDGTLVDSQHNIIASMTDAFQDHGLTVPTDGAIRSIIGLSLEEAVSVLLPEGDQDKVTTVSRAYKDAFFRRRIGPEFHEALYPGVVEVFDALESRGVLLALATGKSRRGVESFIERHGFQKRFVATRCADDGPGKPDPWMVVDAMASVGAEPAHTAMIGDSSYDMEMAVRARTTALGVSWGYQPPEALRAAGARMVAEDFTDVSAFLVSEWDLASVMG
jgi:phosphoglycolate phosphatase